MSENIIDSSDSGIVVTETKITISDEKLNRMLSNVYEVAQKDNNKFKLHNLWGVCWSIAGTLFMALLTSSFNKIGSIEANTVTNWAIGLCVLFTICGLILAIWRINDKSSNNTVSRDNAVKKIIEDYLHINESNMRIDL